MSPIDVSFVMTVYNKAAYLPAVLKALFNQTGVKNPEYIFVDDCSTDSSVEIIRQYARDIKNVTIVEHSANMGPSKTLNQGIFLAKGQWIRMLDSDDIFPLNSTEVMLKKAQDFKADMVYGGFIKTNKMPEELCAEYMDENAPAHFSSDVLKTVLFGRFTRMGQLIDATVLKSAGGADERIFVPDENLSARIATKAHGVLKIDTPVVLVPKELSFHLSSKKIQLDHDRFMSYYYLVQDNPALPFFIKQRCTNKMVSAFWKYTQKTRLIPFLSTSFIYYVWSKMGRSISVNTVQKMADIFQKAENIRRCD